MGDHTRYSKVANTDFSESESEDTTNKGKDKETEQEQDWGEQPVGNDK
jgi:hypothetical protein